MGGKEAGSQQGRCEVEGVRRRTNTEGARPGETKDKARRERLTGGGAVALLVELVESLSIHNDGELTREAPSMSYQGKEAWGVRSLGKAT